MIDLLVMRSALREALRPRRLLLAVLLAILPPIIGLMWRFFSSSATFAPDDAYDALVNGMVFSFTLVMLSVVYGTGVVSQELEQRTIVYLLTSPLPRWRILLAKFVVCLLVVAGVTMLSTLLTAIAVYGSEKFSEADILSDFKALAIGSLTYGSLFLLLGAAIPRPLIYGLLFVFGWEIWAPLLPGSFARISVMSYLRSLAAREVSPDPSQAAPTDNSNFLMAFASAPQVEISMRVAWITLLAVAFVALLAAMIVFSNREYVPRDDSE